MKATRHYQQNGSASGPQITVEHRELIASVLLAAYEQLTLPLQVNVERERIEPYDLIWSSVEVADPQLTGEALAWFRAPGDESWFDFRRICYDLRIAPELGLARVARVVAVRALLAANANTVDLIPYIQFRSRYRAKLRPSRWLRGWLPCIQLCRAALNLPIGACAADVRAKRRKRGAVGAKYEEATHATL